MDTLTSSNHFSSFRFIPFLFVLLYFFPVSAADTTKIACIGNSITAATGLAGADTASYPARLQQMLGPMYRVLNCGCPSSTMIRSVIHAYWTICASKGTAALAMLPDIVFIKLGTNDSKSTDTRVFWPLHKDEYIPDYKAMVDTFANLSSHPKVWACYPLPAFSTAYLIDSTVIHYEILPKIKTVALDKGIPLIDLWTLMSNQKSLVPDGVHPNAAGYLMIAQKIYSMIIKDTLKISQQKNRLAAPQGGVFYQWYCMGIPVPAASGGAGQVLVAKDTGSYKALVGQSTANDDILVTNTVHVSAADLNTSSLPLHAFSLQNASGFVQGEICLFRTDGRLAAKFYLDKKIPVNALRHALPLAQNGLYFVKNSATVFKLLVK
jgi:lysophospholipase L1-like esterase